MRQVNIQEAKTHLSRLVHQAANREPFVIAKAGQPLVKVVPLDPGTGAKPQRLGFMAGEFAVPDGFDTIDQEGIIRLFEGDD